MTRLNDSYQPRIQVPSIVKALQTTAIAALFSLGFAGTLSTAAQSQEALNNNAVQFQEDTVIEFELVDTHGYYQSTFGVIDGNTKQKIPLFVEVRGYDEATPSVQGRDDTGNTPDYRGTVEGGTVVNGEGQANKYIKYTFKSGVPYVFYLDSVDPRTKETKTTLISLNGASSRFSGSLEAGETGNLIEWDDSGLPRPGKDNDFDDFAIIAGGFPLTPCPFVQ